MWYTLEEMNRSEGAEISTYIRVPPDSPWFKGHFPGEPILPGVAQIGLVFDAIRKAHNRDVRLLSVRRVRFKRIIRPDDRLKVIAEPLKKEAGSYSFRILIQDDAVCSGVVTVENRKKQTKDGAQFKV